MRAGGLPPANPWMRLEGRKGLRPGPKACRGTKRVFGWWSGQEAPARFSWRQPGTNMVPFERTPDQEGDMSAGPPGRGAERSGSEGSATRLDSIRLVLAGARSWAVRTGAAVRANEVVGATGAVAYTEYFPNEEKFGLGPKGVKRYPVRRVAE